MNKLLSINYKFFKVEPQKLIEIINKNNNKNQIQGFEVTVSNRKEQKYLLEFAQKAKENNYILNLHSPTLSSIEEYKDYINFTVKVSEITKRKTNIVFHPINAENNLKSIEITNNYIKKLLKYMLEKEYNKNIELSIENLNDINNLKRLKKEDLIEILDKNKDLKFTYDIGHELVDGIVPEIEEKLLIERLNNVHIHTHLGKEDHHPLQKNEKDLVITNKILDKISTKKENISVVLEYALDYIDGVNFEFKMEKYIKSLDFLGILW